VESAWKIEGKVCDMERGRDCALEYVASFEEGSHTFDEKQRLWSFLKKRRR
jgi:hypothetical protein